MKKYGFAIALIFSIIVGIAVGIWVQVNWNICRISFDNPHMKIDYEPLKDIAMAVVKGENYPENENIKVTSNIKENEVLIEVSEINEGTTVGKVLAHFPIDEMMFGRGETITFAIDCSKVKYEYINFIQPILFVITIFCIIVLTALATYILIMMMVAIGNMVAVLFYGVWHKIFYQDK